MINPKLRIGDRVVMLYMDGESFKPGVVGTVTGISNVFNDTHYLVDWDNGSRLQILSDVDKWIKEEDWIQMKNKRKGIKESFDPDFKKKFGGLTKYYKMSKIHKFMDELRQSGVINMFGSSPYLYLGKERIAHEHYYSDTNEHFDNVLEMADEVKNLMIQGALKKVEDQDIEIDLRTVERVLKKDALKIVEFLFKIH